uniref:Uncharacterized protein n=1 Tax=Anguilla anguilla TaxID=7936 RepID=A0A0E9V576_ANGAN
MCSSFDSLSKNYFSDQPFVLEEKQKV